MQKTTTATLVLCIFSLFAVTLHAQNESDHFWPHWRGPLATGEAPHGNPPTEWSEQQNIRWKIEIPGRGSSTPIIWEDMLFVTTAIPTGKEGAGVLGPPEREGQRRRRGIQPTQKLQFTLIAIDRKDGSIIWQRIAREQMPHEGTHQTGSWASNSAVTDGERIYAYFGSNGLYCYDFDGTLLWEKDLGDMRTRNGFGEGSSPALHGDRLIVNWDHEEQSFITALNKKTGGEIWKVYRDEVTSWSSPLVVQHAGTAQVIVNATGKTRSYDPATGKVLWECDGMTLNTIPSPVAADGVVYVTSGFRGNKLQAIDLAAARGEISGTGAIVWDYDRDTPYVPSPLLYKNTLYFLKSNNGILSSFDARTGEVNYTQQRLGDIQGVYASPVAAADRVYLAGRNGVVVVLEHGREFKMLATNRLDDGFDASPAIVGGEIYLRGMQFLYCIAAE